MASMVIEGTIGTAQVTMDMLGDVADVDIGQWPGPVRAYNVPQEDAEALADLIREHGLWVHVNP